jgi:molybdopterin-guanine dinucleotide biosynthesis protein A
MKGVNKAFLVLDNITFIERQISEMRKCCTDITIVTNDPNPFLKSVDRGIRIITDYFPGKGPLSGMHAGLTLAKQPNVWVVDCGMPFISSKAAELLLERKQEGFEAVIPWINKSAHPLHGIYDRSRAAVIGSMLEQGNTTFSSLLKKLLWIELHAPVFEGKGIDCRFVKAIKTTDDYEKLLAWHESLKMNYLYGM